MQLPASGSSRVQRSPLRTVVAAAIVLLAPIACSADESTSPTTTDAADQPVDSSTTDTPDRSSTATGPTTPTDPTRTTSPSAEPGPAPDARLGDAIVVANEPVDVVAHPVTGMLYVPERLGTVRRIDDGALGPVLLDVSDNVEPEFEEGLLSVVFSPDGGAAYLNKASEGWTSIVEYRVTDDGGFDPVSRREVLGFEQPYENHNGGQLLFGHDDLLYVFVGDGGFVADPQRRALDLGSIHGKILRIDPTPDGELGYTIPPDNPYVDTAGALGEIWSLGLRNPWRASFDPATGDLWIGDVGDFAWEELNVAWADEGAGRAVSFGWSAFEGTTRFNEDQPADDHEPPFFEYPHGDEGCSVTAGVRYRGAAIPDLVGWVVFADFCSGFVWALEVTPDREAGRLVVLDEVPFPVSVTTGADGEILVASIDGGIHPLLPVT